MTRREMQKEMLLINLRGRLAGKIDEVAFRQNRRRISRWEFKGTDKFVWGIWSDFAREVLGAPKDPLTPKGQESLGEHTP